LDLKNLRQDAKLIWELTNIAVANNWGYVPLELPVMEDMLKKLKLIVDPDAVWIVEEGDKCIGYCLGFPDINVILKKTNGRMLPFGWAKLLFGAKKLRDYRLFGLAVHPKWQGRGLDSIMYINLYKHLVDKKIRMEANYILEDNYRIKNALEKLGMKYIKTYRIYDKPLEG
jgi:ribosomal protein S18 acetylase RimI-like enzyme